jgi:hypothetical protein
MTFRAFSEHRELLSFIIQSILPGHILPESHAVTKIKRLLVIIQICPVQKRLKPAFSRLLDDVDKDGPPMLNIG